MDDPIFSARRIQIGERILTSDDGGVYIDGVLIATQADYGYSGYSGYSARSGYSGYSAKSGYSGYSAASGYSGFSAKSGYSGFSAKSGYSGFSAASGYSGFSGRSGYSGFSGPSVSGYSGYSGFSGESAQQSGYSGFSGRSGYSGYSAASGYSGFSGRSGYSGFSGFAGGLGLAQTTFQVSNSDFITSSSSFVDITNLLFVASANKLYEVEAVLVVSEGAADSCQFTVAYSAAGATGTFNLLSETTVGTSSHSANSLGNSSTPVITTSGQDTLVWIKGVVKTGANSGNITIQTLGTSGSPVTIYVGSRMTIITLV